jgi:voltage-gated potassium channel
MILHMQNKIYQLLDSPDPSRKARVVRGGIMLLIVANIVSIVIESHHAADSAVVEYLNLFEFFSVIVFSLEYLLRVWAIPASPAYGEDVGSRLKFMCKPMMLIDMLAILPFFVPFAGFGDGRSLRALRLLRVGRILKLGRYSTSLQMIGRVLRRKKADLLSTLFVLSVLLFFASMMMYYAEREAQAEAFPNITESLWWGLGTLTRIGYGTVEPITAFGRAIGGTVAVLGIGLFALPTAIIASGYMQELASMGETKDCPHCGGDLP